jgi:hypothetical protein
MDYDYVVEQSNKSNKGKFMKIDDSYTRIIYTIMLAAITIQGLIFTLIMYCAA